MASLRRRLVLFSLLLYALGAGAVGLLILRVTHGHFTFSLDDPYIHMALAEQIAHGHYGLNATEVSSPSSSVLWPFLLAAGPAFLRPLLPLLWNVLAGFASAALIGCAVAEWPGAYTLRRFLAVPALLLATNLVGLTFLGMEHGLQVFLALCCAFGLCRNLSGRPMPLFSVAAAALAPAIRYEDLALTLAVGWALVAARRTRMAVVLAVVALVPLVLFSIFLHRHGLPLLPVSVLVKGKAAGAHTSAPLTVLRLLASGSFHALTDPARWPLVILCAALGGAARQQRDPLRRAVLAGGAATTLLHLLFGRFGWFHRYEIYALAFAALLFLRLMAEGAPPRLGWYALGLVALAAPYASAIPDSVLSAEDVYHQQFQMHRFAADYFHGNVAVNDLGLVSYQLGPGRYVLDLGGLASLETAREPNKSAAWLAATVARHNVGLVMIYPGLLPIPTAWVKLGTVCNLRPPVALGGACVDYYASRPDDVAALTASFAAFSKTLPAGTAATLAPWTPTESESKRRPGL